MKTLTILLSLLLMSHSDMQDKQSKKDPVDTAFFEVDALLDEREEDREVSAGSIIFDRKGIAHRFHDIEEDLAVLVFFASGKK